MIQSMEKDSNSSLPEGRTVDVDQPLNEAKIPWLIEQLRQLREEMLELADQANSALEALPPQHRASARNLLHYLALRRRDLRPLQNQLAHLGLSSLGRAEPHVLATVEAVLHVLYRLAGQAPPVWSGPAALDSVTGQRLVEEHATALLGPAPAERDVRIMVTMPSEAADDYTLVHELVTNGMNCMRINCAHDDAQAWGRMIAHLRRAEQATQRFCRVLMDLGGPKLRTGPIEPGPAVVKVQPRRDVFGRVTSPARLWLTAEETPAPPPTATDAVLPVPGDWLSGLKPGSLIRFRDARGSLRELRVADQTTTGCWAEATRTAYLVPGTVLKHRRKGEVWKAPVGTLPTQEGVIRLKRGDQLVLTRALQPGRPASHDRQGQVLTPAFIGCTIPEVFDDLQAGERIWFDDGKIGGVIEKVTPERAHVRITHTRARGAKLGADKGINLPDSALRLEALTPKDIEDLAFIAANADMVALSFASSAADVAKLYDHLARQGDRWPALVLKIETRRGFENLPALLLEALKGPCCGVMIARGDLAVECGFERLAEAQEEILWVCEAAHVPVIWATQVLESLAKEGLPSRAEITDAAMGHRAECVMLNKGPFIVQAVQVLDDILRRMQAHQRKKRSMLRELRLASRYSGG
jgi:pyruvate kinase